MLITEKDIFFYVFYPDKLDKDKKSFIEENQKDFDEQIYICKNIQSSINKDVDPEIISEIEKKIKEKQNLMNIELFKVENKKQMYSEYLTLAADSQIEEEKLKVDTFIDANSEYIIKVINTAKENNIFIFEKNNDLIEDFDLKILPSGIEYEHINNQKPLIISPKVNIDKILITIK